MKKIFLIAIAALLSVGMAAPLFADSVPQITQPKSLPTVWTQTVYNGSGSDIGTGLIVEWDFDTSDPDGTFYDDRTNYVQLADSAGDIWTAGVTSWTQGIGDGDTGDIIVRGPALVRKGNEVTITVNDIVETSATGTVQNHDGAAVDEGTLGVAIKITALGGGSSGTIYVNPTQYDKD